MNILQNIIFPSDDKFSDESLYLKCIKGEYECLGKNNLSVEIKPNSVISFASYYNYFSVNSWLNYSDIKDLNLGLNGLGSATIEVLSKSPGAKEFLVKRFSVSFLDGFTSFNIGSIGSDFSNSIYIKVSSVDGININSMFFYVNSKPVNEVKLGIVITHFNRKKYVIPAMKRIHNELLSNEYYEGNIDLIVVDNSQNITDDESFGCTVIPNDNLGGSGGFTRGLIHLKDNQFTHCLFMDDDASCEIESIKRTYQILQFSKKNKLAISGGMLYEHRPTILHEKGAKYKKMSFTPLRNGTNLSDFNNVLVLDSYPEKIGYGAWWFFAFNISDVEFYPFPFFVKADDMLFGIMNKFNIISPNGICVWGEDFGHKDGPMQRYLGTRGTFAASVISRDSNRLLIIKNFMKSIIAMLLSYRYESAEATYIGMIDFMKGPDYWVENMTFDKIMNSAADFIKGERLEKIDLYNYDITHKSLHENKLSKLIRFITLNGMLLPDFFIRNEVVINEKSGVGVFRLIFRSKYVLYYNSDTSTGYIASFNRKCFFKQMIKSLFLSAKFIFCFDKIKKEYTRKSQNVMTESFWRKVYKK